MIAGDQVRVTVTVDVAPDVAFNAFTTEIDRWWRRGVKYRVSGAQPGVLILEPRVGGRLFEQFDDNTHEAGKVTVFDPPNHLAFEWRGANFAPDERTVVEVTFTRTERGATRLDLVHRGFAALRPDHPVRHGAEVGAFLRSIGLWWGDQLSSLREVVS